MDINTTPQRTVVQLLPQACSVPFSSNASTPPTLQSEGCNNELIRGVTASSTDPNHFPDCVIDYSHDPLTFWMSQLGCTTGQFLLFEMRRPRRIPVVWIRTGHHPCAPKDITVSGSRGEPTGPWVALCHGTAECVDPWQRFGIADRTLLETEFSGVKFWD
ncbi:hypothetical protein Pelo_6524 [Pelomyxa schiedti]|nr:hypothetical protein Pelo_6524 [Pelomyxa schiedti]